MVTIDCIADLHGFYPELEGGDLLIVAGDLTARHYESEYHAFTEWCIEQRYEKVIYIGGNHDSFFEKGTEPISTANIQYLCDSGTEFEYVEPVLVFSANNEPVVGLGNTKKLKIWGSPWTVTFPGMNPHCKAFTCDAEEELAEKWKMIPQDTDILITHGPPYGILDQVETMCFEHSARIENVGSLSLYRLLYAQRIRPKLHVFGHIHEGYGQDTRPMDIPGTQFVNCSHVNEHYKPVNKPIRIIL